jgi:hypothetical protein
MAAEVGDPSDHVVSEDRDVQLESACPREPQRQGPRVLMTDFEGCSSSEGSQ